MNNATFVFLNQEQLFDIEGGANAREVVEQVFGVAGAISGGIGGFVGGSTLAGSIFFPIVSIPVGVACGIGAGAGGYYTGKALGGEVYDTVSDIFS